MDGSSAIATGTQQTAGASTEPGTSVDDSSSEESVVCLGMRQAVTASAGQGLMVLAEAASEEAVVRSGMQQSIMIKSTERRVISLINSFQEYCHPHPLRHSQRTQLSPYWTFLRKFLARSPSTSGIMTRRKATITSTPIPPATHRPGDIAKGENSG